MPDDLSAYLDPAPRSRRGAKLSSSQIADTLRQAGWDEQHIPTMTAIAQAESSGNPLAHNPKYPDDSYGLLQVNRLAHPEFSPESLRDPLENARAALKVFRDKKQGFGAWATYSSGAYKKFLNRTQRLPQKPTPDLDSYLDPQTTEQIPPLSADKTTKGSSPSTPENSQQQSAPSIPIEEALAKVARQANRIAPRIKKRFGITDVQPVTGPLADRFRQLGQQRTLEQSQREQEGQVREQVRQDIRGRIGPYGNPTGTGILHLLANPVSSFTGLFKSEDEKVAEETAEQIKARQLAETPEVTEIRKEYGAMPAAERSIVAPLARGGAGLLSTAGGIASAFGIAPNRLSEWANKRAAIIESGAGNAPLREKRGLSSLITGQTELEEVQRGVPEKIATGIADLGVGIGQIILLQKVTKLPFNQLLALEAAAKSSDAPIEQQLGKAAEGYALGSALESHLGRGANAALFGIPTAAQTGEQVAQGRMSPLDAAIQTGIQAGAGAALSGSRREFPTAARLRDAESRPVSGGGLRERIQQRAQAKSGPTSDVTTAPEAVAPPSRTVPATEPNVPTGARAEVLRDRGSIPRLNEYLDEPQTKVQPQGRTDARTEESQSLGQSSGAIVTAGTTQGVRQTSEAVRLAPESGRTASASQSPEVVFKQAGGIVDGLRVREKIPNEASIESSLNDWDELPGIREVPMSVFETAGDTRNKRAAELATRIKESGEINPLIVVVDAEASPYILEGANRYDALTIMGAKSFPAKVVIDRESLPRETKAQPPVEAQPEPQRFYHRDYGEVTESPNQRRVGKGRVRVIAEDGTEHVIKRADMSGRGNQRAVPVKPEPEIQSLGDVEASRARESVATPAEEFARQKVGEMLGEPEALLQAAAKQPLPRSEPDVAAERALGVRLAEQRKRLEEKAAQGDEGARHRLLRNALEEAEDLTAKDIDAGSKTAPKNAAMDIDRAELGLPELQRSEPQAAQQVLDAAKLANRRDPRLVDRLTQQALEGKKNFTNVETMQLNLRAREIKNRVSELQREIYDTKDPAVINEKRVELDSLVSEFDRLSQAQRAAGKEWGRAGIARQRAINEDFSLVSMVARFKAAVGREPKPEERAKIEDLSRRNAELEAKLAEANDQLARKRLQSEVDRVSRRQRRTQSKAQIEDEWAQLKQQFAEIRQRESSFLKSEKGAFDPEAVRLIGKMVRNRVQAGVTNAEQLLDDIHTIVGGDKRELRDTISGYSIGPKTTRSELQRQVDTLKSELKSLSKTEDIAAGRRASRQEGPVREFRKDINRQRAINRQIADLEAQMRSGQFKGKVEREPPRYTRETYRLQKELEDTRLEYERMRYRATASTATRIGHEAIKGVNVLKTLKSIGDVSAMLRQGGFYALSHPIEGLAKPTRAMMQSFTDMGYRNVEAAIKSDPAYETLKKAGVEFTGVERNNPHLSVREEGYLGQEYLQYVPGLKQVANFSERTFVSFLDAQRLLRGKQILKGFTDAQRADPKELKAIASLINAATGRGSLGRRGNAAAPALNIAMFSPRLLASRVQLLRNMIDPVKMARMPPGARKVMIADNVKFLAATTAILGLAKAAGAQVNTDPDDSDFLKIRAGNTTYDTLTGLQQPLRYLINMGRAIGADITGSETYAGQTKGELTGRFARFKLSPAAGLGLDYILGEDFMGRKFSWKNAAKEAALPLPAKDVIEAMKNEGLWGGVKATPTFLGIGVGNYPPPPERATTQAEKLARKITRAKLPDEARTQEEIDLDTQRAQLRVRSRRGEDVSADIEKLRGKITDRQIKGILAARNQTRLQEDVNRLGLKDALLVYSVADTRQRAELQKLIEKKTPLLNTLPADEQALVRQKLSGYGFTIPALRITRPARESRPSRATR